MDKQKTIWRSKMFKTSLTHLLEIGYCARSGHTFDLHACINVNFVKCLYDRSTFQVNNYGVLVFFKPISNK